MSIARRTIECRLSDEEPPQFSPQSEALRQERGAFVTLTKRGALRGCIGYIEARGPLYQTVKDAAASAALYDSRFSPVDREELQDIEIEISVLTPLRRVENTEEIEVGRDGIVIKKGYNQGLLLPQVATEYGWDLLTFLEQTCRKAGLPENSWQDKDTEIWAFSAEVLGET